MSNFSIILDKSRTIRYPRKALKLLEQNKIDLNNAANWDIDKKTEFIYCGLIHEDPELTIQKTEEILDNLDNMFDIMMQCMRAYMYSVGGKENLAKYDEMLSNKGDTTGKN